MKLIIHLYLNQYYSEIKSEEIDIESSNISVHNLKIVLSSEFNISPSEQILTIKRNNSNYITLSDEFYLNFYLIRNNSEIYLNTLENKKKNPNFSSSNSLDPKEKNPYFITRNFLLLIKNNQLVEFQKMLNSNPSLADFKLVKNTKNDWNALHYSCFYGRSQITSEIISLYSKNKNFILNELLNSLTKESYTPLYIACYKGEIQTIKILLYYTKFLDINISDLDLNTPLHIACKNNYLKVVSMLIASNADLFAKNSDNKKPIDLTTNNNIKKILIKSMIRSPFFKKEDQKNVNIDLSLYTKNYFTPPKPPMLLGFVEKRKKFIPIFKLILIEMDPNLGVIKKFQNQENYPNQPYGQIDLNKVSLCKKEKNSSDNEFYFSIYTGRYNIFKVKNKKARNTWVKIINETIIYIKYWKKFRKTNINVDEYLNSKTKKILYIDYRNGEIRNLTEDDSFSASSTRNNIYLINEKEINLNEKNQNLINENNIENLNINKTINTFHNNNNENYGITFNSYNIIDLLGTGSFGKVFKVQLKNDISNKFYAMKVISKRLLMKKRQLKYAISECNVLKKCNCPFIVKLNFSFQTMENLYMIEDFCPGGNIQYHVKNSLFEEEDAKFYLAELVLAIEYLHKINVIYRDLKPENVLIGEDNHIVLVDFGLVKEDINDNDLTSSFCGTPAYIPPEMLNKKNVGKSADIYGLGAVLYEMVSGTPPFFASEIKTLFEKIKNNKLVLHNYFSENLKDLLSKLLCKDPLKRFGTRDKSEIKQHPFFKGINWEKLANKEIDPPLDLVKMKNEKYKVSKVMRNLNSNSKKIKFKDFDYDEKNKFVNRVKNFTFIRKNED